MVGWKLVPNRFFFSDDIPVDIHLKPFLLLSSISELSIGANAKKSLYGSLPVKNNLREKKSYLFSDICATLLVRLVNFFFSLYLFCFICSNFFI